jgi:hypothetical protein
MPTTGPTAPGNSATGATTPRTAQPGISNGATNSAGQPQQPAPGSPNAPTNGMGQPAQTAPGDVVPNYIPPSSVSAPPATGNPNGQNTGR